MRSRALAAFRTCNWTQHSEWATHLPFTTDETIVCLTFVVWAIGFRCSLSLAFSLFLALCDLQVLGVYG